MYMPVIYDGIATRYRVDETGNVFDTKRQVLCKQHKSSNGYMCASLQIPGRSRLALIYK